ncbi:ficolin-1-like [Physella acuta]|uniref:ficolin-1-like n=1 Tax=Physella acuta TaxID=109671 RepID=UPI0027DC80D9|nr:ficolin-1-like [Physella acuta]
MNAFIHTSVTLLFSLQVLVSSLEVRSILYNVYNQSQALMLPMGQQFSGVKLATCALKCLVINDTCFSFAYNDRTEICSLGTWLIPFNNTETLGNMMIYSIGFMCNSSTGVNNLTMISTCPGSNCPDNSVTIGKNSTFDPFEPMVYTSCLDVISDEPRKVVTLTSGLVVMCDTLTDGGGWTIFQRRVSGTVDFYRGWEEYKHGFGDYGIGEFYLGNENIFCLTSKSAHELRVHLVNNTNFYAKYSSFKLSNESLGYKLSILNYTGNAGDSLSFHNNHMFSTFDRDNDDRSFSCSERYFGAWWYAACHRSNLNGQWGNINFGQGLTWSTVTGFYSGVQASEMKIRPINS